MKRSQEEVNIKAWKNHQKRKTELELKIMEGSSSVLPFYERAHELPTTRSPALGIDFSSFVTQMRPLKLRVKLGHFIYAVYWIGLMKGAIAANNFRLRTEC
ncbi:hypothetical protein Tco_0743154 [Tanacetum coccineum]